jgi:hypothetical protein
MPSTNIRRPSCVGIRPADMRAVEQAEVFEILHHVADRRGADLLGQLPCQRARPDRIAGIEIALDHAAKHLARAVVHLVRIFGGRSSAWHPNPVRAQLNEAGRGVNRGCIRGGGRYLEPANQAERKRHAPIRTTDRSEMRAVSIEPGVTRHAEGSCLIRMGDTHVLCTATIEDACRPSSRTPAWAGSRRNTGCCRAPRTRGCGARRGRQSGRTNSGNPAADRAVAARRGRPGRRWASARSRWIATCCRPMAARAAPRSRAAGSRCGWR